MMLVHDAHHGVVHRDEPRLVQERSLAGRFPRHEVARGGLRRGIGGDERVAVVLKAGGERPDDQEFEPLHSLGLHRRHERADDPPQLHPRNSLKKRLAEPKASRMAGSARGITAVEAPCAMAFPTMPSPTRSSTRSTSVPFNAASTARTRTGGVAAWRTPSVSPGAGQRIAPSLMAGSRRASAWGRSTSSATCGPAVSRARRHARSTGPTSPPKRI